MKFLGTTLFAAAIMASTALAAASEPVGDIHAPALRRSMHHQKRKSCSAGSHKKSHKSKKNGHKSHSSSGGSASSGTSSNDDKKSSDNDSSDSSSSSSSSNGAAGSTGKGKNLFSKMNGKQGLAWPNANGMNIKNFMTGRVSWWYSWKETPGWSDAPTDLPFCPMLWGEHGSGANVDGWKKNVLDNPNGKYNKWKCMLGPNEVNQKGQADMSAEATCSLMKKYMMPLADQGWYLIGPSTTSAPDGLEKWYPQFKKACPDVFERLDAISLHYYDVKISDFKNYVTKWHQQTGKPVIITEFACQNFNGGAQCSKGQAAEMMKEMSDWFNQQEFVLGYAPFGTMQNLQGVAEVNRLSQGSNPTTLFRTFADAN